MWGLPVGPQVSVTSACLELPAQPSRFMARQVLRGGILTHSWHHDLPHRRTLTWVTAPLLR